MIVLRSTMDAAVEAERWRYTQLATSYGEALRATSALQRQLADWITDKGEALTPEQAAALFYSKDNRWQAAFFNALPGVVKAAHDAMPPRRPNEFYMGPGVPYGETQWCWMADHLNDDGRETIEAMHYHAKRETVAA